MTAAELLNSLSWAGATLEIVGGKVRIQGARISSELMQALKANRAEVLAEFERRRALGRNRYGRVPPPDAPLLARDMDLPEKSRSQIMAYVFRQPRTVHAWVMARANDYFDRGIRADDCEWRACVDVVAWQRASVGQEAVKFILELPSNEELGIQAKDHKRAGAR